uniref:Uncharacterized protein n=1 Tax=Tetranychus urticae TaxID=32264 RepID=T1JRJ6_TETUR
MGTQMEYHGGQFIGIHFFDHLDDYSYRYPIIWLPCYQTTVNHVIERLSSQKEEIISKYMNTRYDNALIFYWTSLPDILVMVIT